MVNSFRDFISFLYEGSEIQRAQQFESLREFISEVLYEQGTTGTKSATTGTASTSGTGGDTKPEKDTTNKPSQSTPQDRRDAAVRKAIDKPEFKNSIMRPHMQKPPDKTISLVGNDFLRQVTAKLREKGKTLTNGQISNATNDIKKSLSAEITSDKIDKKIEAELNSAKNSGIDISKMSPGKNK